MVGHYILVHEWGYLSQFHSSWQLPRSFLAISWKLHHSSSTKSTNHNDFSKWGVILSWPFFPLVAVGVGKIILWNSYYPYGVSFSSRLILQGSFLAVFFSTNAHENCIRFIKVSIVLRLDWIGRVVHKS